MKTRSKSSTPLAKKVDINTNDPGTNALLLSFFSQTPFAFALCKTLLNKKGTPVDYEFLHVNQAFERQTGLKASYVTGKRATDIHPGIEKTGLIEIYGKVALTGKPVAFETVLEPLGKHYHIKAWKIHENTFATSFEDVSDLKQVEEQLMNERNQLLAIFDSIDEAVYVTDTDTYEILFINRALRKQLTKNPIGGTCYKEFQGFDKPCPFCTNHIITKQKPKPYKWEYHNPKINKTYAIHDQIIRWPDGRDVRLELAIDITAGKEAENALRKSEETLKAILRSIGDGVIATDTKARITNINKAAEQITGWTNAEVKGRPLKQIFNIVNANTGEKAENPVTRALREGIIIGLANHTKLIARDGKEYQIADSCAPVRDISGNIIGAVLAFRDVTEEYNQREALFRNEEKFRLIAEASAEEIWQLDKTGKMTYASPNEKTFGYKPADVIGMHFTKLLKKSDIPVAEKAFIKALSGEPSQMIEVNVIKKDGADIPLEISITPISKDGQTIGVQGIARDITERKKAENALRESEKRLAATLNSIGDAVITTDMSGNVIHLNPVAERLTGWTTSEALGKHSSEIFRIINEQTRQPAESPVDRAMKKGIIIGLANHTLLIARDGTERPIADSAAPILDENDTPLGVVLVFRDQTVERAAENALRESEERFRTIFESVPVGIFIHDTDNGEIITANQIAVESRGLSSLKELQKNNFWSDPPYSFKEAIELIKKTVKEGPQRFEWFTTSKSGKSFWEDILLRAVEIKGQKRVVAGCIDITARKHAEESLKQALREKETLLRELYHRTKNNMQVIQSMLSMQAAVTNDESLVKIFRETESRIRTMALIHQKLYQTRDLSRIDLHDYIHNLVRLLVKSYNFSGVKINVKMEIPQINTLIDIAMPCGLILNELVSNTLKYAFPEKDSGNIYIRVFKPDPATIDLYFADDGVGLPDNFDFRRQKTVGMQIIFALVEQQLQGSVDFKIENGLTCHIRFTDTSYKERI